MHGRYQSRRAATAVRTRWAGLHTMVSGIYTLSSDLSFRTLYWDGDDDAEFDVVQHFRSGKRFQNWTIPPIRGLTYAEELDGEEGNTEVVERRFTNGFGDFPWYSVACLVFSARARSALKGVFAPAGEFLPFFRDPDGVEYFAFNCTNVVDALDVDQSEIEYFSHGPARRIVRYALRLEAIEQHAVFRMEWPPQFTVFAREDVVSQVEAHQLVGLETERIWPHF